jgi:hypothetical protein
MLHHNIILRRVKYKEGREYNIFSLSNGIFPTIPEGASRGSEASFQGFFAVYAEASRNLSLNSLNITFGQTTA